jgi:hypothetical protein
LSTTYSDWAYVNNQASPEEIAPIRDIVTYAKKPETLPEIKQNEAVNLNIDVENKSEIDASSVAVSIFSPDGTAILNAQIIPLSLATGQTATIPVSYSTTLTSPLGIYRINYVLLDSNNTVIQTMDYMDSSRFVVSNPPQGGYQGSGITFSVQSDSEQYPYGSDATFTILMFNNTDTDKTITAKYFFPHHFWIERDPQYGGDWENPNLNLTHTLSVPAKGQKSFTHTLKNARSADRLWAYFYDANNQQVGMATTGFYVFNPSVNASVQTDKTFYLKGEMVNLALNLQNKQGANYTTTLKVRVSDPSNVSIYSNSLSVILPANGTSTQALSFTLSSTAQKGYYIVSAEAYDSTGKKIGGSSTSFDVPSALLSINPVLPATLSPNSTFQASFEVKNIWATDVPTANLKVDFVGPTGNTLFTNTEEFNITSGQTRTFAYNIPTGIAVFGNYHLKYLLTYAEKVASGEKLISRSYTIQNAFDKITYSIGDSINATINIANTGKFQEDLPLKVEVPEFSYSNTISISTSPQQTVAQPFSMSVPGNATSGKHTLIVTLGTASITKTFDFYVPESKLELSAPSGTYSAGDNIPVTVSNTGGGGTNYELNATLTDTKGIVVSNQILTGAILAKEAKAHNVAIPSGALSDQYILRLSIKDKMTNKITSLNTTLSVTGISGTLSIRTEKDVYLDTEGIRTITYIASTGMSIPDAELNIKVVPAMSTGTVRGTVINAATGILIQGAKISIGDKEAYTTSQGEYVLTNISVGTSHTINIIYPGFDRVTSNINVVEGSQTFDAALYESKYGTLKGTIKDSITGDPIVGAKVEMVPKEVLSSDAESRISFSNFEGISEIKLPTGSYTLRITKEGYQSFETEISVTEGMNERQFLLVKTNIQLPTMGELSGRVMDKVTNEILLGVEVKLDNTLSNRVQMNEETYHFYDISPDSRTLSVHYAGYDRFETAIEIVAGQQSYDIFLTPSLYGNLTGTVKHESTGNAIVGAKIELTPLQVASSDQSSKILHSDFTGLYALNKIPVGTYALKVTRQYYSDFNTTVTIQEGTSTFDINLQQVEQIPNINEIEPNNNLVQATPLNIDENGYGTIYPSADNDYYKVTVPGDGTIKVTVSDIPSSHQYKIYLYNSAGSTLANTGDVPSPGPGTLSKFVDQGGDYYVSVRDTYNQSSTSPYRIRVEFVPLDGDVYVNEPNGNIATATTLPLDKTERGYLYFTNDNDYYKVTVPGDGTIKVAVSDIPSSHQYKIYLYNSAGNTLANTGDVPSPGPGTLSKFVDQGGDYYVSVRDTYYSSSTSPYRIYTTFSPQNLPIEKVIFEKTISPVNLTGSQTINEDIPAVGMTGKFVVTSTLKSSTEQVVARAEYPFYIIEGNTLLLFATDKKVYKPGETVTITGEVRNLATITASALSLQLSANSQNIYTATFDVPANGSHPFTITTTAGTEGTYTLTGKVTQNNSVLAEITDSYEVASPKVSATVSAPEVAGNEPFDINVEMKNEGKVNASIQLSAVSDQGNTTDDQQITIPAGETKLIQYSQQVTSDTIYTFTFYGDLEQTITKTVKYGLNASISVDVSNGVYPEGRITIPVTINNTGQLDETLEVIFQLSSQQSVVSSQNKTYYVPKGGNVTDTLYYDLTEGEYQLTANSQLPTASAEASFSVRKENKVDMVVSLGTQTNELIPVTMNLANKGYNSIGGSIRYTVVNSQNAAVWSGETAVSQLLPQNSQLITFNINPYTIATGDYTLNVELLNDSGQQLAAQGLPITIQGPTFQITQSPPYQTFFVDQEAIFTFRIKNTGNQEGAFDFNLKAYDLIDSTQREWLKPGEEKAITFNFLLPEDLEEKDYFTESIMNQAGQYTLIRFISIKQGM